MVVKKVNSYKVYMYATVAHNKDVNARITCYCPDNHQFHIYFIKPGVTVKPSETSSNGRHGFLFMPFSSFPYYVDILRNEKPLYVQINTEKPSNNMLITGSEEVGEGEL